MTEGDAPPAPRPYPVTYDVQPHTANRNRVTVGFRIFLAIPQAILVGGPGIGFAFGWLALPFGDQWWWSFGAGGGALAGAAWACAFISWFAIVFTGRQPRGLWDFTRFFMRWWANVAAYSALLRDDYPPFASTAEYPVAFEVAGGQPETRDRWSVGLRLIYAIPHIVVLFFVGIAWFVTAVIGWFAILFTGSYPGGLYRFAVGYLRWSARVQAYMLLMRDEYPPFSLS